MMYYDLKYPSTPGCWVATLGQAPEQKIDPETGKEDFTEQRSISSYLEEWRPIQKWNSVPICLHFKAQGRKLHKADRIFHGQIGPIMSENAVGKMRILLEKDGHILPLDVMNSDEKFYLWWVPWIEESVDMTRSEKFPNGKTIKRYAFNHARIRALTAFRPHYAGMYRPYAQGQVLVNEEFKRAWLDANLTGIEFKPA